MAEIVGLAFGGVSLLALFETCLKFKHVASAIASHEVDASLAATKIDLLHTRLLLWGEQLSIRSPGQEHRNLRDRWPKYRHAIFNSLLHIERLLRKASQLTGQHDPKRHGDRDVEEAGTMTSYTITIRLAEAHPPLSHRNCPTNRRRGVLRLWQAARWALGDQGKLENFTKDLASLIENLEKVSKRLVEKDEPQDLLSRSINNFLRDFDKSQSQHQAVVYRPTQQKDTAQDRPQKDFGMQRPPHTTLSPLPERDTITLPYPGTSKEENRTQPSSVPGAHPISHFVDSRALHIYQAPQAQPQQYPQHHQQPSQQTHSAALHDKFVDIVQSRAQIMGVGPLGVPADYSADRSNTYSNIRPEQPAQLSGMAKIALIGPVSQGALDSMATMLQQPQPQSQQQPTTRPPRVASTTYR